jgi:Protein of unknown function (DUF3460)
MGLFRRPDYKSDATAFIHNLEANSSGLHDRQMAGRTIFWNKNIDRSLKKELDSNTTPQKPYVYQPE